MSATNVAEQRMSATNVQARMPTANVCDDYLIT
jgi:hypothetical protein